MAPVFSKTSALTALFPSDHRIASKKIYSWQANYNYYLPGNYCSIAKQFLRCTLHQLVSNQIFFQLFQSRFESELGL